MSAPNTTQNREQGKSVIFDDPSPWPESVDPSAILDQVYSTLDRFVIAEPRTLKAASLWAFFTHLIDVVKIAPIANITAPERNCGKSTLLESLRLITPRALKTDNVTPAAIFRIVDRHRPTLLIDEVDAFLRGNEDLRGILNSGHEPEGKVLRVVGDNHEPKAFRTFGAKALCGIGDIQSTLASRSIRLELRRKLPHEKAENLRFSDKELWTELHAKLAAAAEIINEKVQSTGEIEVPGLSNRAADNWQPLLAIADAVGDHWPTTARRIALEIESTEEESPDIGTELLADVRAVFSRQNATRLWTTELLQALIGDDEAPWAAWNRGSPIKPRQLSRMLKPYGGKPIDIRKRNLVKKGYEITALEDAFRRYLTLGESATARQVSVSRPSEHSQSATADSPVAPRNLTKPAARTGGSAVAENWEDELNDVEYF